MQINKPLIQTEWSYFSAALIFYTRIPIKQSGEFSDLLLNKSRKYFPLIGLIIGFIACLVFTISQAVLPITVSIVLSIIATVLATGAFHEDGFADSCDGLGGGWDQQQVLRIMKDSRIGSYALVGFILLLLLKYTSLVEIAQLNIGLLFLCLLNAHGLSRLFASLAIEQMEYVQDLDNSKAKPITSARLSTNEFLYSAAYLIPTFLVLIYQHWALIFTLPIMYIVYRMMRYYLIKRIGGYTGDCLGATQQLCEVLFYLCALALI